MKKLRIEDHPTVKRLREKQTAENSRTSTAIRFDSQSLRQLALDCGAADAGLVEIGRSELDNQREEIVQRYPWTKTLLSFVCRMNPHSIRSTARSVANLEMHHQGERINEVSRLICERLVDQGYRAVNPSMGFPMEMAQFPPGPIWVVAHKPVAVAASLGHMGIHRNVIHPKFGNHILLGTVLIDSEATEYDRPVNYNPCLECNLCVAACPVGAISTDGEFSFSACFTHNYREFMGGFGDWVEQIADSKSARDYRRRVSEPETASFWQSLSFGPNYKSAYCLAVCPAGEDLISPFIVDRPGFLKEVVKPLQERKETVYVVAGSDAEEHVRKRFKHKQAKAVGNSLRPRTLQGFLDGLPYVFQKNRAEGLEATYHFTFTGAERRDVSIVIRNRAVSIVDGYDGTANLHVTADALTWLGFVAKEKSLVWALLTRKIRLKGSPRWLVKFGKCFPTPGARHTATEVLPIDPALRPWQAPFLRNDSTTGKIKSPQA